MVSQTLSLRQHKQTRTALVTLQPARKTRGLLSGPTCNDSAPEMDVRSWLVDVEGFMDTSD